MPKSGTQRLTFLLIPFANVRPHTEKWHTVRVAPVKSLITATLPDETRCKLKLQSYNCIIDSYWLCSKQQHCLHRVVFFVKGTTYYPQIAMVVADKPEERTFLSLKRRGSDMDFSYWVLRTRIREEQFRSGLSAPSSWSEVTLTLPKTLVEDECPIELRQVNCVPFVQRNRTRLQLCLINWTSQIIARDVTRTNCRYWMKGDLFLPIALMIGLRHCLPFPVSIRGHKICIVLSALTNGMSWTSASFVFSASSSILWLAGHRHCHCQDQWRLQSSASRPSHGLADYRASTYSDRHSRKARQVLQERFVDAYCLSYVRVPWVFLFLTSQKTKTTWCNVQFVFKSCHMYYDNHPIGKETTYNSDRTNSFSSVPLWQRPFEAISPLNSIA